MNCWNWVKNKCTQKNHSTTPPFRCKSGSFDMPWKSPLWIRDYAIKDISKRHAHEPWENCWKQESGWRVCRSHVVISMMVMMIVDKKGCWMEVRNLNSDTHTLMQIVAHRHHHHYYTGRMVKFSHGRILLCYFICE